MAEICRPPAIHDDRATIDGQSAERGDDRRDACGHDQKRVADPHHHARADADNEHDRDAAVRVRLQPVRRDKGAGGNHRADREVDLARDDDERLAKRDDADQRRGQSDLFEILGVEKARLAQCHSRADHQ